MRTKKYWEEQAAQRYKEKQELENKLSEAEKSLRFLLADPNPYRVTLTPVSDVYITGSFETKTRFEYVDEKGIYHKHIRNIAPGSVEVLSTSKETAILKFETTKGHYTYWIFNKALETVAEISLELLSDMCDSEVRRLIKYGK
jgi:hypothetical protein